MAALEPTEPEKRVLAALKNDARADFRTGDNAVDDANGAATWGAERTIRAEFLRLICAGERPDWRIGQYGVHIHGAQIDGSLNLGFVEMAFPLTLIGCRFTAPLDLSYAHIPLLALAGSRVPGLNADRATIKGDVFMGKGFAAEGQVRFLGADVGGQWNCNGGSFKSPGGNALNAEGIRVKGGLFMGKGFAAEGEVRFLGADIGLQWDCSAGRFENPGGKALSADGATVKGDVLMGKRFAAEGAVRFPGTDIGGEWDCTGGKFQNPNGDALNADRATVKDSVFMGEGFAAEGEVRFLGAEIAGQWDCTGGSFKNPAKDALNADGVMVKGGVFMGKGFAAEGEVRFLGAEIRGQWSCTGGKFRYPGGKALSADRATVKGNLIMRKGFEAEGEVRFLGAEIAGQWDCTGGSFKNPAKDALNADEVMVKGGVLLREGFAAEGEVRFLGADIGGQWDCTGGSFNNPCRKAFSADGATVKGAVFMREGFAAEGEVRFPGADIGGQWDCTGGSFTKSGRIALNADGAKIAQSVSLNSTTVEGSVAFGHASITQSLLWRAAAMTNGTIDLEYARIGVLDDDAKSWPERINLNGLVFDGFAGRAPTDSETRIAWLRKQARDRGQFFPQPYEQVVKVLRSMGHDGDAREVAIAKQVDWRRSGALSRWARFRSLFLGATIGHGYRPWLAIPYMAVFLLAGYFVFDYGNRTDGAMIPVKLRIHSGETRSEALERHPKLVPLMYSADLFLPIVNLHQEDYWLPNAKDEIGFYVLVYMWLQIAAGWVLTTVFVAGITGLVKRD